jgi:hypothetical protein
MEKPKTHIDVKVSVECIKDSLRKKIVSEHSALIANVIIGNLAVTEVGLEQLYKAMSGVYEAPKYKIGDLVRVKMDDLYSWNFDKQKTEELGTMIQGRILCQIREIDLTKLKPYNVGFTAVSGDNTKELTCEVAEIKISLDDEWPENLEKEDDLPF